MCISPSDKFTPLGGQLSWDLGAVTKTTVVNGNIAKSLYIQ